MVIECMQYKFNQTGEYNPDAPNECRGTYEECARPVRCKESNKNVSCFAVWRQKDNITDVLSAGCHPYEVSPNPECGFICKASQRKDINFCCCNERLCNKKEILRLPPPSAVNQTTTPPIDIDNQRTSQLNPVILYSVILSLLALVLLVILFKRRNKQKHRSNNTAKNDRDAISKYIIRQINDRELNELRNSGDAPVSTPFHSSNNNNNNINNNHHKDSNDNILNSTLDIDPLNQTNHQDANGYLQDNQANRIYLSSIKLLEVVGSGRFGTVHRATMDKSDSEIAVKIIQASEHQSWLNELQIYSSPRIKHPNILGFLGTSESTETNSYWLVVEYASKGSLYSYLKENVISWKELIKIALGISNGLSHLHDIDIAHRDFKTKNVLLRHDLTPCITDFGVALILDTSAGMKLDRKKKYLQVGTPRYMAPEVLECSVLFTNASFKKIDVYALSLVLWELLSRCYPLPVNTMSHCNNNFGSNSNNNICVDQKDNSIDHQHSNLQQQGQVEPSDNGEPTETKQISSEDSGVSGGNGQEGKPADGGPTPYRLPFEEVTGSNPDINTMRQIVNVGKHRPPFRPEWFEYPTSAICRLCADGWEYDCDARISASCFVERVEGLLQAMNLP